MIVKHNLMAMNSSRYFNSNKSNLTKSAEKLSSGYRINKAGDNSTGLAISEKIRRQVRGLSQATRNAQDGVLWVQVADGAIHEVQEMLQRGNELAVKATNGLLSDTDREYINQEFQQLKDELNNVNGNTAFNGQSIFTNESSSITGNGLKIFSDKGSSFTETTKAQNELTDLIANEYIPTAMSQIMKKMSGSGSIASALTSLKNNTDDKDAFGITLNMKYLDGPSGTIASMEAGIGAHNFGRDVFMPETLTLNIDSADFSSADLSDKDKQVLQSTVAHELMHGVMDVLLTEGMSLSDHADDEHGNLPEWFIEGSAQLIGGGYTTGWNAGLMQIAMSKDSDSVKLSSVKSYLNDGTYTVGSYKMSQGGSFTVEDRPYGHGYLACAYLSQIASGAGESVTQNSLIKGANKIFNALVSNESNYENFGVAYSFEQVIDSVLSDAHSSLTLNDVVDNINSGENDAAKFVLSLTNASKNTDRSGLYGAGSLIAPSLNSTFIMDSTTTKDQILFVKDVNSSAIDSAGGSNSNDLYLQLSYESESSNDLNLQLGYDSGSSNFIRLKKFSITSDSLGLTNANTLTQESSAEAIDQVHNALVAVTTMRSYYGAAQNRLTHVISNLDNMVENTISAETAIRETDMATETINYSNANILAQAGQSMLTQANQSKNGVMTLLDVMP